MFNVTSTTFYYKAIPDSKGKEAKSCWEELPSIAGIFAIYHQQSSGHDFFTFFNLQPPSQDPQKSHSITVLICFISFGCKKNFTKFMTQFYGLVICVGLGCFFCSSHEGLYMHLQSAIRSTRSCLRGRQLKYYISALKWSPTL